MKIFDFEILDQRQSLQNKFLKMCCCCSLRTHTKVIAVICLIFTLGAAGTIGGLMAKTRDTVTTDERLDNGGNMGGALAIQIPIYLVSIMCDVLCLVGAIKGNKCMLVPFMVKMVLLILADAAVAILLIVSGGMVGSFITGSTNDSNVQSLAGALSATIFILLIPLLIGIGIAIYFLVIVVRYFKELSSGGVSNSELSTEFRNPNTIQTFQTPDGLIWKGGKYVSSN